MGCGDRSVLRPLLSASYRNKGRKRNYNNGSNNNNNESDEDSKEQYDLNEIGSGGGKRPLGLLPVEVMAFLRKLLLLVWKNLLFRKRHYILTAFEIILPTILVIQIAWMKTKTPAAIVEAGKIEIQIGNQTFPVYNQTEIFGALALAVSNEGVHGGKKFLAYAPVDLVKPEILQKLEDGTKDMQLGWMGFNSEKEIEASLSSNTSSTKVDIFAAVIFEKGFDGNGNKYAYKIRIVEDHVDTRMLFPIFETPGPNMRLLKQYLQSGFLGLQILVDKAIIETASQTELANNWVTVQGFPYPEFSDSADFSRMFTMVLPMMLCVGFLFIVTANVKGIVGEKETGIKELLKMLGLPSWLQLLGWMINSLIVMSITVSIIVFLLFYPFNAKAGPVVQYSNFTVWWVVLIVFVMNATAMCFLVSSFFQRPTLATTVGVILWLVAYFALVLPTDTKYATMGILQKLLMCLLPQGGLTFAIKIMSGLDGKAVGAHWYNLFESASSVDQLSIGIILSMMLLSTVLCLCLTLYFENIIPSEFGVRKPWYYVFEISTWKKSKTSSNGGRILTPQLMSGANTFEADPAGAVPGIEIINLRKNFGSRTVVNDISVKMFEGQITALLGHNGAGKTTTISMLTGLIAPTSGRAIINGYDINTDLEAIHESLGLCPQHNMLFDELTVGEHLKFFAMLKGKSGQAADFEVKDLLKKLQLSDKINVLSRALSGGQKRKLNLGISLIGDTKTVILDEPTSGMDPEARRAIWDLLLEMRGHRTILLTTHFMEEADVLGDRIAIMADGQIKCAGTPLFLKRIYGAGYTLTLTTGDGAPLDMILLTVQNYFSAAYYKSQIIPSQTEVAIIIPSENTDTSKLPGMFGDLYKRKDEFCIKTIGMALTTMDDVFIKVGESSHVDDSSFDVADGSGSNTASTEKLAFAKGGASEDGVAAPRSIGISRVAQQFYALFVKRMLYTLRKRKLFISQLLLPTLLVILAIKVSNSAYQPPDAPPAFMLDLKAYKQPVTLFDSTSDAMGKIYTGLADTSAKPSNTTGHIVDELLLTGLSDLATYRAKYIVAAELSETKINALYSTIPYHAAPLSLNLASNTMLRKLTSSDSVIETSNHPLHENNNAFDAASVNPTFSQIVPVIFAILMPVGLALAAASFLVFPVEERLCKAKQLQLMTGVNPFIYWFSSLCWDMILMVLLIFCLLACFPIFEAKYILTSWAGMGVLFLVFAVYGFAAISFSYLISFVASNVVSGFTWTTIIHIVSGVVLCIIVFVLDTIGGALEAARTAAYMVRLFARFFPTFGASLSTMKFVKTATSNSRCRLLSEEALKLLCDPKQAVPTESRSCCPNCIQDFPAAPCFEYRPYLEWTHTEPPAIGETVGTEIPGIGQEVFFMALMGLLFQILIFLIESGVLKRLLGGLMKNKESVIKNVEGDEDVKQENEEIANIISEGRLSESAMVVSNLSKNYGSFAAVSNLNFRVKHGECFGLLGVNGAGKTTSFRMLTGDEVPSSGNAFASTSSLTGNRENFLSSIGYCPQFDGIIGVLTGIEMVQLFCRLRGVRADFVQQESRKWMDRLGLTGSNSVQCRKYSGGMKRRLSTAMALVGDPPIVMLDEPTSGVDPIARRQFWNVIATIRSSGQAVILTSHSMEECEALCNRLGIMVNGQIQCLGGVEHLKHKYAQGYSLLIKLTSSVEADSPDAVELQNLVIQKFGQCALKDKHQNILLFQILDTSIPWDILYQRMEDIKVVHSSIIEDYCINATTLEEIFLSFARRTYQNRVTDQPWYRRMLLCL